MIQSMRMQWEVYRPARTALLPSSDATSSHAELSVLAVAHATRRACMVIGQGMGAGWGELVLHEGD